MQNVAQDIVYALVVAALPVVATLCAVRGNRLTTFGERGPAWARPGTTPER